jgi:hypothetical protein
VFNPLKLKARERVRKDKRRAKVNGKIRGKSERDFISGGLVLLVRIELE